MASKKVRVAVNGYGVIGKRVADAIRLQPDMELIGVADVVSDYRVKTAVVLGLPVFASLPEKVDEMKAAGIPVAGTLDDLLAQADVVVDATPKGIGARNLERYRAEDPLPAYAARLERAGILNEALRERLEGLIGTLVEEALGRALASEAPAVETAQRPALAPVAGSAAAPGPARSTSSGSRPRPTPARNGSWARRP